MNKKRNIFVILLLLFISFNLIGCTYSEIKPPKQVNDLEIIPNYNELGTEKTK